MTSITNKEQLLQLIEKQNLGTLSAAEEAMLQQWFEQVPAIGELTFTSEEEKEQIRKDMHEAIFRQIGATTGSAPQTVPGSTKPFIRKRRITGIAAAALLCVALLSYFWITRSPEPEWRLVTAPKGISKLPVTLSDSSVVWLTEGSSLRYPEKFGAHARKVELDGVAFFSVHPDKKAPFTVATPDALSVKVLGTSFVVDVRRNTQYIKVSVITGRVQVEENKKGLSILLPGDRLSYSCQSHSFQKDKYLPEEVSEWKNNGTIYLNNVSLNELSVILQTIYKLRLVYDARQMSRYRFSMSFSKDLSAEQVLDMLRVMSGLRFEKKGSEVRITEK